MSLFIYFYYEPKKKIICIQIGLCPKALTHLTHFNVSTLKWTLNMRIHVLLGIFIYNLKFLFSVFKLL